MSAITNAVPLNISLFECLAEPVLVFDASVRLIYANRSALEALPCDAGMGWSELGRVFDVTILEWLRESIEKPASAPFPTPPASLVHGHQGPVVTALGGQRWALVLPIEATGRVLGPRVHHDKSIQVEQEKALHDILWSVPFPVILQDESFRLIDANPMMAALIGVPREQLIGQDPVRWQTTEEQSPQQSRRQDWLHATPETRAPHLSHQTFVDDKGARHATQAATYILQNREQQRRFLSILRETPTPNGDAPHSWSGLDSASQDMQLLELDEWFAQLPQAMMLLDENGRVLRANHAFDTLLGFRLEDVSEASQEIRLLLHWGRTRLTVPLEPGQSWFTPEAFVPGQPDQVPKRVRSLLRCHTAPNKQRRYMYALDERPPEERRDPRRVQPGSLFDMSGAGSAITREREMALSHQAIKAGPIPHLMTSHGPQGHQTVSRDRVLPSSLHEFERLQHACKHGERCEVRYAIRDAEQGERWFLTRVEPDPQLAHGVSVITFDITEQQLARERAEHLMAELHAILEGSPAGIASLRGYQVVRSNRRFERILHLHAGGAIHADLRSLLAARTGGLRNPPELMKCIDQGDIFEDEVHVIYEDGLMHWYTVTVRRAGPAGPTADAVVVLSETSRLRYQQEQLETVTSERANLAQILHQQSDRSRAVLDAMLVGVVTVNQQGTITWLNRPARRMFCGDLKDFYGEPLASVAPMNEPDHPFRHCTSMLEKMADSDSAQFEAHVQGRDGRRFLVVGNMVATLNLSGGRELTFALMDMDQRRMAEARVADARGMLQRIMAAAPMAITVHDASTLAIEQMNPIAADLAGVPAEEAIGCTPDQLFPPDLSNRLRDDMRTALSQPTILTQREYHIDSQGTRTLWDARFVPLARDGEQPDRILLVAADITAQRAELGVLVSQREMLVQEVQNRVRNNLQDVTGLLKQAGIRRPEVHGVITEVIGQVQAIAQIYGLSTGPQGLLSVVDVVEAVAQSVQHTFGQIFELQVHPATLPWLLPDGESIPFALIINELMSNAVKHSTSDSPLSCQLQPIHQGIRLEVVNEGLLPSNFRVEHRPTSVAGLGLVRALLPRRHASLSIEQNGDHVSAIIELHTPVITRPPE
ncbi:MAG: PAS domain-containing protein [Leptothrix ochracea]|uniref:PAS domain-containing protein n=1 Tax=Leptothrix ochracea TaxID=735331 RepID=UPI0034E1CA2F